MWEEVLANPEFLSAQLDERLLALNETGGEYRQRYLLRGRPEDLDRAIACLERALAGSPAESVNHAVALGNLANALRDRAQRSGAIDDLSRAIALWADSLALTPLNSIDRPTRLANLALGMSDRYDQTGDLGALEQAVNLLDEAATLGSPDRPTAPALLNLLGGALSKRHFRTQAPDDAARALAALEEAVTRSTNDDVQLPAILSNLAVGYATRHHSGKDPADLDRAIAALERAVKTTAPGSPIHPTLLGNLAHMLIERHEARGDPVGLDCAIQACEVAIVETPAGAPALRSWLFNLGRASRMRHAHSGDAADIDRAVDALTHAAQSTLPNDPELPKMLGQTGLTLQDRYRLHGARVDLDRAIAAYEQALAGLRTGSHDRGHLAHALACALKLRFDHLGEPADLDRAESAFQEAAGTCSPASLDRASTLDNLSGVFQARYLLTGDAGNLERAIGVLEDALASVPEGSVARWTLLGNFGTVLRDRYLRTGNVSDLDRGIQAIELAVRMTPAQTRELPVMLGNLGLSLVLAYEQTHLTGTLERALQVLEQAARGAPGPIERAFANGSFGLALAVRARSTGRPADFDGAVAALQAAIDGDPTSRNLATYLGNLGRALLERHQFGHELADLDRAIASIERAASLAGMSPLGPWHLLNVADMRRERFQLTGEETDRLAASRAYAQVARAALGSVAPIGLRAALTWGDWAFDRRDWEEACEAYSCGLDALDQLFRTQLSHDYKRTWLRSAHRLAARAACSMAKAGRALDAAVALERGRALLIAETLDRRAYLVRLRDAGHGDLDERYHLAVARWREVVREDPMWAESSLADDPWAEMLARRWDAWQVAGSWSGVPIARPAEDVERIKSARAGLDAAIEAIREMPGFEDFLKSPGVADVLAAAGPMPLVYLVATDAGGLALVVRGEPPSATPVWLPQLSASAFKQLTVAYLSSCAAWRAEPADQAATAGWLNALANVTMSLWPEMRTVIEALGTSPRATLIPCGWLAFLPLHAAWTPDALAPTGRRYACDALTLTYAPSARALAASQAIAAHAPADALLAVDEPKPVSALKLGNATREVKHAVSKFKRHRTFRHGAASRIKVLDALPVFAVLHFACHAWASLSSPLESGLVMAHDELLTVRDFLDRRIPGARLAVLSACETAIPGAELPDECVGLPGGLLQAGVAGIAASLWSVADVSTALLMHRFYDLWRGAEKLDPAEALRSAAAWVRDTTNAEKVAYLLGSPPQKTKARDAADSLHRDLLQYPPGEHTFAHPFHWAAFVYVGT